MQTLLTYIQAIQILDCQERAIKDMIYRSTITGGKGVVQVDEKWETQVSKRGRVAEWQAFVNSEQIRIPDAQAPPPIAYAGGILGNVPRDMAAQTFFENLETPKLMRKHIERYTLAASTLNRIGEVSADPKTIKQTLGLTIGAWWEAVCEHIKAEDIALPASYKRLRQALKDYQPNNYETLVESWRFGNDFSKKVKGELAEALLEDLIANPFQHDDTIIADTYNIWAQANGHKTITAEAVGYRRNKRAIYITAEREGVVENYKRNSKRIHRQRASAPLLLCGSDDNILDLYFLEEKVVAGKVVKNYYWRPAIYVVMDTYNDYILGWAIGETVNTELIKRAWANALHHIYELTGNYYAWHQIQTDRWGISSGGDGKKKKNELRLWFESHSNYTPATAKISQGKYIERAFGTQWHQELKKRFKNYAGHNITAQERLNPDAVELYKRDYPSREVAAEKVAEFVRIMRNIKDKKTGKTRQEVWVNAFFEAEKSKEKQFTAEQRIAIFGQKHIIPRNPELVYTNTVTADGLVMTIGGQKLIYDVPDSVYMQALGRKVRVVYDPYNLNQVLVTDDKQVRFLANAYEYMPSALADFKEGDRAKLNSLLNGKKEMAAIPAAETANRKSVLQRAGIDPYALLQRNSIDAQSLLQSGNLLKAPRHEAERIAANQVPVLSQTQSSDIDDDELNIYRYL